MKTIIILTALLTSQFVYANELQLHQDAANVANMIRDHNVSQCIDKLEKESGGKFLIVEIYRNDAVDLAIFDLKGPILTGDVAKGYKTLRIENSYQIDIITGSGRLVYSCPQSESDENTISKNLKYKKTKN